MASRNNNYGSAEENMELITRSPTPESCRIRSHAEHDHDKCKKLIDRKSPERKLELRK